MTEWDTLMDFMKSLYPQSFRVVFNEHGRICGVVWEEKEKKKSALKLYQAGADATRA